MRRAFQILLFAVLAAFSLSSFAAGYRCGYSGNWTYFDSISGYKSHPLSGATTYQATDCMNNDAYNTPYPLESGFRWNTLSGLLYIVPNSGTACPSGMEVQGDDCIELPPVECPEGQIVEAGQCVGNGTPPEPESDAPEGLYAIGTSTASGVDYNATGQTLDSGGQVVANCGGWACSFSGADQTGSQCYDNGIGTTVYCSFIPKYFSTPAALAQPTDITPVQNVNPTTANPTVLCPTGYVLNSSGICTNGATPSTPSTINTPSTAPTTGIQTCPAGFALNAENQCVSSSTNTTGTCPNGYTLVNGHCTGTSTLSSAGPASNSAPVCGGPGLPPCEVSSEEPTDFNPISEAVGDKSELEGTLADQKSGVENWADPSSSKQSDFFDSWINFISPIPASACSPISADVGGKVWTIDPCPTAEKISTILNYVLWVYLAFGTFVLITGGKST